MASAAANPDDSPSMLAGSSLIGEAKN